MDALGDPTTNGCDGYAALPGLPKADAGRYARMMALLNGNPNASAGLAVGSLLALALAMIPARKRRQFMKFAGKSGMSTATTRKSKAKKSCQENKPS